ncbi:hypothetical protein CIG19_18355 [Enterobacterales bacterium CwR94]|nr:hypothetical protein CIG19_18355 [Enterobacterales bacterium CwR94]
MQPAARVSDSICHGGAVASGSGNVFINSLPAAVVAMSVAPCSLHGAASVASGSGTVFINSLPAARLGDVTGCGSAIVCGSGDVKIG